MEYFADAIVEKCVRWGQSPLLIGVLGSPKDRTPIGIAREIRKPGTTGPAWSISIRTVALPGMFVVVDGKFVPADSVSD
jgi:hypothetical protein